MIDEKNAQDTGSVIFDTLKAELLDLTIKPGEEIIESDVCQRFNVTRPPVRTAMRRLADVGLVEIKPYYGTHATLLNMDKIFQIIHMRIIIETKIVQDFIESNPNSFIIEELEHNLRLQNILLEQTEVDRTKFFELDNELHETWFKARHCQGIWEIIQSQKIEYTRFRMLDYKTSMMYPQIIQDHANIIEEIKKKETKNIAELMGQHLNNGIKRMGDKVLKEFRQYIIEPKDSEFWQNYNIKYFQ